MQYNMSLLKNHIIFTCFLLSHISNAVQASSSVGLPTISSYINKKLSSPSSSLHRQGLTSSSPSSLHESRRHLIDQCKQLFRDTNLDHFSWANTSTFKQRYFICDRAYKKGGNIFFYLGNEAPVTLYLNNTGLMWELAAKYNAVLVFAEHRYYGESKPFPDDVVRSNMQWLTTEQAMADYATLVWELRNDKYNDPDMPVIGFGGSYGGMLAAWFRMKYPHLLTGAVAASAPIWTYLGERPKYDPGSFAEIVTRDATEEAGSAPACADNVRATLKALFKLGKSAEGRSTIARAMKLCEDSRPESSDEVMQLAQWIQGGWDYLAMGDYPYASSYMTNGDGELPAWPVREACNFLALENMNDEELLGGMASAIGIFYNATGRSQCFDWNHGANNETDEVADFWDFQFCSEQWMPMSRDGKRDMFWKQPFNTEDAVQACEAHWGVKPRKLHATIEWGGKRIETASNIVFSNGLLDPWSSGGVLDSISETLVAVIIPEGGHHLDLFFSHPDDPASVKEARNIEEEHIARWIKEARGVAKKSTNYSGIKFNDDREDTARRLVVS